MSLRLCFFMLVILLIGMPAYLLAQIRPAQSDYEKQRAKRTYDRYDVEKYITGKEKMSPEDSILSMMRSGDSLKMVKDKILLTPEELRKLGVDERFISQLSELNGMEDSIKLVQKQHEQKIKEDFRKKYDLPRDDTINTETLLRLIAWQKREVLEKALQLPEPIVYGQEFFRKSTLRLNMLEPELDHKVPENYVLSTGDEISVAMWGNIDYSQTFVINKEGYIKPPLVGLIYLKGMTFAQARDMVRQKFAKTYDLKKSQIAINVSFVRLIAVNFVGELLNPGTYRFPALTSVYNALVAIAGPNQLGSMRNIYIKRNGTTVATLDLYQYLFQPDSQQDFFLEHNDYIVVTTQQKIVYLGGEVKRPYNYELKEQEGLTDLVRYGGGLKAEGYRKAIHIKRYADNRETLIDVDYDELLRGSGQFALQNGDSVMVARVEVGFRNHVVVDGAIRIPGQYQWRDGDRITDLIAKAQGVTEYADNHRAYIVRLNPSDKSTVYIPFRLGEVLKNPTATDNFLLQNRDTIRLVTIASPYDGTKIKISGAVRKVGDFPFTQGMSLRDALYLSGGIEVQAANNRIEISRLVNVKEENTQRPVQERIVVKRIDINQNLQLDPNSEDFPLQPYDHVFVRQAEGYEQQQVVKLYGEVVYPGEYILLNRDEDLATLLERAGGLTPYAFGTGAKLYRWRDSLGYVLMDISKALTKQEVTAKRKKKRREQELALLNDLSYNYILADADSIFIPKVRNLVTLAGAIQHFEVDTTIAQISAPYEPGHDAKYYVINYGAGFSRYARRKATFVQKANGEVNQTRRFLWWKRFPKVENGATVYVAENSRRAKEEARLRKEIKDGNKKDVFSDIATKVTTVLTILVLVNQIRN